MLSDLLYRMRALLARNTVERDLEDELRFHLEQQTAKHLRAGKSPKEAARLARLELAGEEQVKENCRDARGTALVTNLIRDLRYGLRQMRQSPAFAATSVLILALGIGANTAIFTLLDAVMLRTIPVKDLNQLVVPSWTAKQLPRNYGYNSFEPCTVSDARSSEKYCSFSYPMFRVFAAQSRSLSSVAAFVGPLIVNSSVSGFAERAPAELVSGNFFQTLGVKTIMGRHLLPSDDLPASSPVVVLSYDYWQAATAADPRILGKTIRLNKFYYTVVGVGQPGFHELSLGYSVALWLPFHTGSHLIDWVSKPLDDTHAFWLKIIGRMRPGVTQSQVQAELGRLFANGMIRGEKLMGDNARPTIQVSAAADALIGLRSLLQKPIYLSMVGVALILLIACANIATLLTARAASRHREIAIRLALGAGRARIVRQLLTESTLLALLGGAAGIAIAYAATQILTAFLNTAAMNLELRPDGRILLFVTVISLGSGIAFGLVPALQSTGARASHAFGSGEQLQAAMTRSPRRSIFRQVLIVLQVALSAVMLAGSILFVRTLHNLNTVAVGFNPERLLTFGLNPENSGYKLEQIQPLYARVAEQLRALPGAASVAYSSDTLLDGHESSTDLPIEGRADQSNVPVYQLGIGPNFLQTLGISLIAGRDFNSDELNRHLPVAIVNREFVRRYLPKGNPIGRRFGHTGNTYQIVGVMADAKYDSVRSPIKPTAYFPLSPGGAHFEIRTAGNPELLKVAVEKLIHKIDRNLPVFDLRTETEQIDRTIFTERLLAQLSVIFGTLALLLTAVGLYGLLSYEVARRVREIGIRVAIGAQARQVLSLVLGQTVLTVALGLLVGLLCSAAATHLLTSFLFGVEANDPLTFVAVTGIFLAIAALAAYLPARRATRVDPAIALRYE